MKLETKGLLILILSFQIGFLSLIISDQISKSLYFNPIIHIVRQVIGFLYLTFVPGFLLLGILRINSLSKAEIVLYSVGLSLSFLMFAGFFMNLFYPLFGFSKPISEMSLAYTISIIVLFLCAIFYYRNKEFEIHLPNRQDITRPVVLLFALFPFVACFGAYFLAYKNNNIIAIVLFGFASIIPILASMDILPIKIFRFVIWIISVSLLLMITLSLFEYVNYADGGALEHRYTHLVCIKGFWDSSVPVSHNAMLNTVILRPIQSVLLKATDQVIFRIVYPLVYSLTPLALYISFSRQTNEKIAFLSTFFFISVPSYYMILSRNTRTGTAEFFLALFILSRTDKNIDHLKRTLLSTIFALSIIVSHYGTSYLFMLSLISVTLLFVLIRKYIDIKRRNKRTLDFTNFTLLFAVSCFAWYMFNAHASPFRIFVNFFNHMIRQMSELFTPETSYTVYALSREWTFSVKVSMHLILAASMFITIGIASLIWNIIRNKEFKFQLEFSVFSIVFFGILLATFLPTKNFNPMRVYHLALCFLAPFSVIGFIRICKWLKICKVNTYSRTLKIFSVFLAIFLLFNSGVVSEVITKKWHDYSPNIVMAKPRAEHINDAQFIYAFYFQYFTPHRDFYSAEWLLQKRDESVKIYIDYPVVTHFLYLIGPIHPPYIIVTNQTKIRKGYIFLGTYNIIKDVSIVQTYPPKIKSVDVVYPLNISNKIYTNDCSEIYYR